MPNLEDVPELNFTPEGRKFEYALVREYKKGIIESKELSKESKDIQILLWDDYIKSYEECYQKFRKDRTKMASLLN